MEIKLIDREVAKQFREEFQEDLDLVAAEYGLTAKMGGIKYSTASMKVTIEFKIDNPELQLGHEQEKAEALGLPPECIGYIMKLPNGDYRVIRIDLSKRKYPIIATNLETNRDYKFRASVLEKCLADDTP